MRSAGSTDVDLSSGRPASAEAVTPAPPDVPFWTEHFLFALYDPAADVSMWLHLGTVPNDPTMWEDWVLVSLPGDEGVLSMWAYHRTAPERRPAGSNLAFECIEPFRRWRVTFDGFANQTRLADLRHGRVRDGKRTKFSLDLEINGVTPLWDAHQGATAPSGRGSMTAQGWAKEHYEQLYRFTGVLRLPDRDIALDGTGWRDHSRGPRGGGTGAPWGGHVITGCLDPETGSGWGACRYWAPDGTITLAGGYLAEADGSLQHAEVLDAPRLRDLHADGERLEWTVRSRSDEVHAAGTTAKSMWVTMRMGNACGVDLSGDGLIYALNWGWCEWDGKKVPFYCERSDVLGRPVDDLRH